jgi:predicted anti-sigma-YlaC factor YlaD
MDCRLIQPELVRFHFGDAEEEVRAPVEEHLLGCAACLKAYLSLKREIETSPERGEAPSMMAKARLRKAVAAELASRRLPATRRIAWGTAVAAAAATLLMVFAVRAIEPSLHRNHSPSPDAHHSRSVDSVNPSATLPLL